ncbi:MAG: hypothetical protein ACI8P3_003600 [Saprospiraceae bacterium]|jgi:hypothetical protein
MQIEMQNIISDFPKVFIDPDFMVFKAKAYLISNFTVST